MHLSTTKPMKRERYLVEEVQNIYEIIYHIILYESWTRLNHISTFLNEEWVCKNCKHPDFLPEFKGKTWGEFEKRNVGCDECKKFCNGNANCEGIVCRQNIPENMPKSLLSSCIWMTNELKQQCEVAETNEYLTCWKRNIKNNATYEFVSLPM